MTNNRPVKVLLNNNIIILLKYLTIILYYSPSYIFNYYSNSKLNECIYMYNYIENVYTHTNVTR